MILKVVEVFLYFRRRCSGRLSSGECRRLLPSSGVAGGGLFLKVAFSRRTMRLLFISALGVLVCLYTWTQPPVAALLSWPADTRRRFGSEAALATEGSGALSARVQRDDSRRPSAASFVFLPCPRRAADSHGGLLFREALSTRDLALHSKRPLSPSADAMRVAQSVRSQRTWPGLSETKALRLSDAAFRSSSGNGHDRKTLRSASRTPDSDHAFDDPFNATRDVEDQDEEVQERSCETSSGKSLAPTHPGAEVGHLHLPHPLSFANNSTEASTDAETPELEGVARLTPPSNETHWTAASSSADSSRDINASPEEFDEFDEFDEFEKKAQDGEGGREGKDAGEDLRISSSSMASLRWRHAFPAAQTEMQTTKTGGDFPGKENVESSQACSGSVSPKAGWRDLFFQWKSQLPPSALSEALLLKARRCIPTALSCLRVLGSGLLWMRQFSPATFGRLARVVAGNAAETAAAASVVPALLFSFSALTDALDGALARRWKVETARGALLDAVADKLLVGTALAGVVAGAAEGVCVSSNRAAQSQRQASLLADSPEEVLRLLVPAAASLTLREVAVQALRQELERQQRGHLTSVSRLGKLKMIAESTALPLLLLLLPQRTPAEVPDALALRESRRLRERTAAADSLLRRRSSLAVSAAAALGSALRVSALGVYFFGERQIARPSLLSRLVTPVGAVAAKTWRGVVSCLASAFWSLERGARAARTLRLWPQGGFAKRVASVAASRGFAQSTQRPLSAALSRSLIAVGRVGIFAGRAALGGTLWLCRRKPVRVFGEAVSNTLLGRSTRAALRAVRRALGSCEQALRCTYIQGTPSLLTVGVVFLWSASALAFASAAEYASRAAFVA